MLLDIGAPTGTVSPGVGKAAAEHVENILETAKSAFETAESAAAVAGVGIHSRMAKAVVLVFLVRIGQDGVGLVDFLEFVFGFVVSGILVRMILHGHLSERRFDLVFRRAFF